MKPALAPIGIVFLLALSEVARARDEAKFYPPTGWTVTKQPEGANYTAVVQPPGSHAGRWCDIDIMLDMPGEVNAVFATSWRTLTRQIKVVSGGEPLARRSMAGFETRSTTAVVEAPDTGRAYMHFFAVQVGPNVRRVLFLSDNQ